MPAHHDELTQGPWPELIAEIHHRGHLAVAAVAGGGSSALARLAAASNAARTLLEGSILYSDAALTAWVGGRLDRSCSASAARAMAMSAWKRGLQLAPGAKPAKIVGVGSTASLLSQRPQRATLCIHVAVQTRQTTRCESIQLAEDGLSRDEAESLIAAALLISLGRAVGCQVDGAEDRLARMIGGDQTRHVAEQEGRQEWADLLMGRRSAAGVDGPWLLHQRETQLVLPGAFNPMHHGHLKMAEIAERRVGAEVVWEISLRNVDKPTLDWVSLQQRLEGIARVDGQRSIAITADPTFQQKARRWPGAVFAVGVDTIGRIGDPRYYGDDPTARDRAIQAIAGAGCRFLVFGRVIGERFTSLSDLGLPEILADISDEVVEGEFRLDLSSTDLRG